MAAANIQDSSISSSVAAGSNLMAPPLGSLLVTRQEKLNASIFSLIIPCDAPHLTEALMPENQSNPMLEETKL
jgi:hypothetical protein